MNCTHVIPRYKCQKDILCYCTVCIAGLIDDFFGGGGVTEKNYLYLGGHGKKFNDWGGGGKGSHAIF